jgi:hypothetical protein
MWKQHRVTRWLSRVVRWLFGAPFRDLPPAFGDTVPPELRAYEEQVDEMQHHPVGKVGSSNGHGHKQSKPTA